MPSWLEDHSSVNGLSKDLQVARRPGAPPDGDEPTLCFVVANVDAFEDAWTLPRDDLRFYLALHEVVHAALRSVRWVRARLVRLAVDYVSNYEIDPMVPEIEPGVADGHKTLELYELPSDL